MDVMEAIRTRRSIRRYTADPVADDAVQAVLEAARWAPSWKNTQCARFIVVRDAGVKAALAECLIKISVPDGLRDNPSTKAIINAPVVIVGCAVLGKSGYDAGIPATDKGDWYMFDVALAMQNLALAAHALGLGTVQVGQFDAARVAALLGVPESHAVVSLTPLGYPEQEGKNPGRKELAEIIFYERYGQVK
ncbi:MAG: nitroreductase family protein [Chloroflexota bacterium]